MSQFAKIILAILLGIIAIAAILAYPLYKLKQANLPAPTMAPIAPTPLPTFSPALAQSPSPTVSEVILPIALQGGAEFADPTSYQSRALARTMEQVGIEDQTPAKIIQYYALYCIFLATNGVSNTITESEGMLDVPGWEVSDGWESNTIDPCSGVLTWHGVVCDGDVVKKLELSSNRLTGAFPPEVTLLASDGPRETGAGALQLLNLYANPFLTNNGDNTWWSYLGSALEIFNLDYTGFSGRLGRLPDKINEFDCSHSLIAGGLTDENFEGLNNLEYANLGGNTYNAPVPSAFTRLPNLRYFYIDNGAISGDLSYMVGMPAIKDHVADSNPNLGGQIPAGISTVSTLELLSITDCSLSGTIPPEFGNFGSTMKYIWLVDNDLTGPIPSDLGQLSALSLLHLEGNSFTGSMPAEVCANRVFPGLPGQLEELGADCSNPGFSCDCCSCCSVEECDPF